MNNLIYSVHLLMTTHNERIIIIAICFIYCMIDNDDVETFLTIFQGLLIDFPQQSKRTLYVVC